MYVTLGTGTTVDSTRTLYLYSDTLVQYSEAMVALFLFEFASTVRVYSVLLLRYLIILGV